MPVHQTSYSVELPRRDAGRMTQTPGGLQPTIHHDMNASSQRQGYSSTQAQIYVSGSYVTNVPQSESLRPHPAPNPIQNLRQQWQCPYFQYCGKSFKKVTELSYHMQNNHSKTIKWEWCLISDCAWYSQSPGAWATHYKHFHVKKLGPYKSQEDVVYKTTDTRCHVECAKPEQCCFGRPMWDWDTQLPVGVANVQEASTSMPDSGRAPEQNWRTE